jgi:lysozyme
MRISKPGIDFIKVYEAFRGRPYICPAGYLTTGYGHVIRKDETVKDPMTEPEAEALLQHDLIPREVAVNKAVTVPITQTMYDPVVSFVFNVGEGAFSASTLRRKINSGEWIEAADEFPKWCYGGGRKPKGLLTRRLLERKIFLRDILSHGNMGE